MAMGRHYCIIWALMCPVLFPLSTFALTTLSDTLEGHFKKSGHTNNWAVLVSTSRFWFNYRHMANVLSIYRSVKRLGIPDSHIILMLADDMACNSRNPRPATIFNNANQHINVYGDDVEVDYRGYEVTVENFIRILTGRLEGSVPRSKRLLSDDRSNILVYMSGHGGDGFLKFQDAEEISSNELADAFEQMWQKKRYHQILFMIDTCQAASMYMKFYSPNLLGVASSLVGEDAYSHHVDPALGIYMIDRFTYHVLEFLENVASSSNKKLSQLLEVCPKSKCLSTVSTRSDLFYHNIGETLISDFFGNVHGIELNLANLELPDIINTSKSNNLFTNYNNNKWIYNSQSSFDFTIQKNSYFNNTAKTIFNVAGLVAILIVFIFYTR